jgi:BirA family transcriptional regulator, biotin operon repressor / biotin---[acetyl-CoA-carboxylase] ligase
VRVDPHSHDSAGAIAGDPIGAADVLPLLLELVQPGAPWVAGVPYEYLAQCASTNAALKQAADSARSGATVITDDQTGGRGRLGRTWMSDPGRDLCFSVLVRPTLAATHGHLLSLATGVAVAEALERALGLREQMALKWPNDVLLDGRKVCGILLEASTGAGCIHWAVAGIGLNVNSEPTRRVESLPPEQGAEWRGRLLPVSLKEHLGHPVARAPLLAGILARLTFWLTGLDGVAPPAIDAVPEAPAGCAGSPGAEAMAALLDEWRRRDALVGRRVEVSSGSGRADRVAAGVAAGIGEEGQLLVRTEDGAVVEVFAGDVTVATFV